jgi:cytochrome c556
MKFHILFSSLSLLLAVATTTVRADPSPPAAPKQEEKTPLEKQMDRIRKSMRSLRSQIDDPAKNDSSLLFVATVHDAATTALNLTPAKADDFSGADRDLFIAHFQAAMKEFIAAVDRLTAALNANDNAEAAKIYKELPGLEKKDHKEFRRPEKD